MTRPDDSPPVSQSGATRRKVLRGAAWAAPAVVVAGAAPALAASPTSRSVITFAPTPFEEYRVESNRVVVGVRFTPATPVPSGTPVTVVARIRPGVGSVSSAVPSQVTSGWTVGTGVVSGSETVFTLTRATQLPGTVDPAVADEILYFRVGVTPNPQFGTNGTVTVSLSAPDTSVRPDGVTTNNGMSFVQRWRVAGPLGR